MIVGEVARRILHCMGATIKGLKDTCFSPLRVRQMKSWDWRGGAER